MIKRTTCTKGSNIALKYTLPEDRRLVYDMLVSPEVMDYMFDENHPPTSWDEFLEEPELLFSGKPNEEGNYLLITLGDEVIGSISYSFNEAAVKSAELDIWMSSLKHTGKGYGTQAINLLIKFIHENFNIATFLIRPWIKNTNAIKAYKKCGFREIDSFDASYFYCPDDLEDCAPGDYGVEETVNLIYEIEDFQSFMFNETKILLSTLFSLPETQKISIKNIEIFSASDDESLKRAVGECYHDKFSDVDINIEINISNDDFESDGAIYADCLDRLGLASNNIGVSHYTTPDRIEVIRLCKDNGMRFDLIISTTRSDDYQSLPHGYRDVNLDKCDNFWFTAVQALGKLMRNDYLISSHLAHNLLQEGLVLQMIKRDEEKKTDFHRYGDKEDLTYLNCIPNSETPFIRPGDDIYNHIAHLIYSAVKSYDELNQKNSDSYRSRIQSFVALWKKYMA